MNTSIDLQYGFRNFAKENLYKATSLVAPGGGASPAIFHKMFLTLFRTNPHLYPGVGGGGSGFTLTGALLPKIIW